MSKSSSLIGTQTIVIIIAAAISVILIGAGLTVVLPNLLNQSPQAINFINNGRGPNFNLVDQDSNNVTLDSYNYSEVLIINFIYTHCPDNLDGSLGTCSLETTKMNTLLGYLLEANYTSTQFHIISISFDYLFDNPQIMKQYGLDRAGGKFEYWSFLSGSKEQTENATKSYFVYAEYFNETDNTTSASSMTYYLGNLGKLGSLVHNDTNGWSHSSVVWLLDKNRDERMYHTGTDWKASDVAKEVEALIKMG